MVLALSLKLLVRIVLEAKLVFAEHPRRNGLVEPVEHLLEQLPRAMRVGIGKRGARRCLDPKVRKLSLAALQAAFDLAQRMRAAKLTEQHRYELAPTRKSFRRVLGAGRLDHALELKARNKLEYLTEHAA